MDSDKRCQMTVSWNTFGDKNDKAGYQSYGKCDKPAKYEVPHPTMGVQFVCGIHAHSLDKTFIRIGSKDMCIAITEAK